MRLYLASNDLGDFAENLVDLVGSNKKALIMANARDYCSEENRKKIIDEDTGILRDCGFDVVELDLRGYFGKPAELRKYIDDLVPGLIFAIGGNVYALATALNLSGMDDILWEDLAGDKYVYGGYSAGSMVASRDLLNYLDSYGRRSEDRFEQAKGLYGEACTEGLGLIDEYIVPHADEEKFKSVCKKAEVDIASKGLTPIVLNNSDVVVVDGENCDMMVKRG